MLPLMVPLLAMPPPKVGDPTGDTEAGHENTVTVRRGDRAGIHDAAGKGLTPAARRMYQPRSPACPALIVPLLEMPPVKLDTPVTRTPIPALALMVPVLAIDPDEVP